MEYNSNYHLEALKYASKSLITPAIWRTIDKRVELVKVQFIATHWRTRTDLPPSEGRASSQ